MKRIFKIGGLIVGILVVLLGVVLVVGSNLADRKIKRTVTVDVKPVAYASGPEVLARGQYLFMTRGCMDCHDENGKGRAFINDPNGFYVKAPGITVAPGSRTASYQEVDWVRTIRHGVNPQGRPLFIMPSEDYNRLTDNDLAAVVAYVRSLPPQANEALETRLPLPVKVLYGFGAIPDAFEKIDHTLPPSTPVPADTSAQHGAYVANMCIGCHGQGLSGGKIPGAPPDWPAAANLTPGENSVMPRYDGVDAFKAMMRSGKRPNGSAVNTVMPFDSLKNLNDTELTALHAYLKTLPAKAAGNR
ncbi:MAG: c-type cytochrome [Betaproteobacteria bacterium]|nr:c-type cytochrome [Betaproteobacteria bacterium]